MPRSVPAQRKQVDISPPGHPLPESARDRLIVALDLSSPAENDALVQSLGRAVSFYKLGWGLLLCPGGPKLQDKLLRSGSNVFLDLKFFDVPNSVAVAVSAAAAQGVRFITVHGNREIITAAAHARGSSSLRFCGDRSHSSLSELEARRMYGMPDNVTLEDHVVSVALRLGRFRMRWCDRFALGGRRDPSECSRSGRYRYAWHSPGRRAGR